MKSKPSFKEYAKSYVLNTEWYFDYKDKDNNRLFKEVGAFKARIIKEIILILLPVLILGFNYIAYNSVWYDSIKRWNVIWFAIMAILPFIMLALHIFRYEKVKFVEIRDIDDAKDANYKIIEVLLGLIYIIEINYVTYLIAIM